MQYPRWIGDLLDRFDRAGEEAYLVGGCVRDTLLGLEPHDFDMTTSTPPERTMEICADLRVIATGLQHGTVTVITEGGPVEITTFRIDGAYTDARHPDAVRFSRRVAEDLARRDFTVNAMAYHPVRGMVDLFDGQEDLRRRVLRTVGDPRERFCEDALRILRAFRFSAQLGFSIHPDTLQGASDKKEGLARIAKERIAAEFLRLLTSPSPQIPLEQMIRGGILPYVTPSYTPSPRTVARLSAAPADPDCRLGLFFSDTTPEEARAVLRGLKCSNRCITGATAVVRGAFLSVSSPRDAGSFRAATGDYATAAIHASVLLEHSPADAVTWIEQSTAPCRISELAVTGRDLGALGLSGKELGETLSRLLAYAMEDPDRNRRQTLLALAKQWMDIKEE